MRSSTIVVAGLLGILAAGAGAEEAGVLKVTGRGVEGRPAYRGGGAVKFLDASVEAHLVHLRVVRVEDDQVQPRLSYQLQEKPLRLDTQEQAISVRSPGCLQCRGGHFGP